MLKSWSKKLFIAALELFLISGAFWYLIQKKSLSDAYQKIQNIVGQNQAKNEVQVAFPVENGPVLKNYSWQYKGVKYELSQTLYESSYEFYKSQPKVFSYEGTLPLDWQERYYGMFLQKNPEDHEFSKLATDIESLGRKNKLTDDQIVELTLSFVQSIPYDDAKAKLILSKNGDVGVRYPYEVIFENLGVCSDKSILASVLLREMGYGTALFAYEDDNHMALGIECPKDSSTYGNGYCYAETTAIGNKIGIIPSFDQVSNKTVQEELKSFDGNQLSDDNLKQLGQVTILQVSHGKLYGGVRETQNLLAEIASLKKQINNQLVDVLALKKQVEGEEKDLGDLKSKISAYEKKGNIQKYNELVPKYNDSLLVYKKDAEKYNSSVTIYNQAIARYNLLIRQ